MMDSNVENEVREVLAKRTSWNVNGLSGDADLSDSLGLDSLDLLNFAADIELHFDIVLPDGELSDLRTLTDVAGAVRAQKEHVS